MCFLVLCCDGRHLGVRKVQSRPRGCPSRKHAGASTGGHVSVADGIFPDHVGQGHGNGFRSPGTGEDHGKEKLIGGRDKHEDGRGRDSRGGEGHDDPEQGLHPGTAVDAGRALQILGNSLEVAVQNPDRYGQQPPGVAQNQGHLGVDYLQPAAEDNVQGDQVDQRRDHLGADQGEEEVDTPFKVQPGQGITGYAAKHHTDHHGDTGNG